MWLQNLWTDYHSLNTVLLTVVQLMSLRVMVDCIGLLTNIYFPYVQSIANCVLQPLQFQLTVASTTGVCSPLVVRPVGEEFSPGLGYVITLHHSTTEKTA